ncbi:hypothetical protein H0H93_013892, partial [Arthromyces matolae]
MTTPTPGRPTLQDAFDVPQIESRISRKKSLGQLASPSSPSLSRLKRPALLTRSVTLPRVTPIESKPRRRQAELDQHPLEPETIEKIRRWIIGIAIGSQSHSFRIREHSSITAENRRPTTDGFIYGYAHFTQTKDPTSKRGYEQ